jgi:hypothetical protein
MKKDLSLKELFQEYIQLLKRTTGFRDTLIDVEHKKAFDLLLKETWSYDEDAISRTGIPSILDVLNLLASIHNKRSNEKLRKKLVELERKIKEL